MPKGQVPERDVVCRACGATFRSIKVGRAAFYCRTTACDAERGVKPGVRVRRKSTPKPKVTPPPTPAARSTATIPRSVGPSLREFEQRNLRQQKEREAREAADREAARRARIEEQRLEAKQRRAAMGIRERNAEARSIERQRTMFDPITDDYKSMLLVDEFMETIQRATELDGARREVKAAIVKLANAVGVEARWNSAIDLAAAAMALAGATPHSRVTQKSS